MRRVSFDEEPGVERALQTREPKGLTRLVIAWGLAKDQTAAERALLVVLVTCVVLIVAALWLGRERVVQLPPPEEFRGM